MNTPSSASLAELLEMMKRQNFTGATIVHWANGKLKLVEFPSQRLQIVEKRVDVTPPTAA